MQTILSKKHIAAYFGLLIILFQLSLNQIHTHEASHDSSEASIEEVCDLCDQWNATSFLLDIPSFDFTLYQNVEQNAFIVALSGQPSFFHPGLRAPPASV